ncbi:extracellular matrix regulator RemB [Salibacterium aidingense]|uniref:extracellular matrix regulator RemB n=1 Tax=Salibacterium aidingense TaxID=384933 RepID=UPI0004162B6C|nr:extracellular matrix/biofilm biosynthesis regulator RemA family protein [Salibacterium aidingense]
MFIHLGGDTVIRSKDVITIVDQDTHDSSSITQQFLASRNENDIERISAEQSKSVVVTTEKIYLSPISTLTLKRRAQMVSDFDDYSEDSEDTAES